MKIIAIISVILLITMGIMHLFPQINFREMPDGLIEGKLPKNKPNWVSSRVPVNDSHYVPPLKFKSLEQLSACISTKLPQVVIQSKDESKLIAYRQSRLFNFVDWLCIHADGMVSSSATMGHSDLGKNKELVEQIRAFCS